MGLDNTGVRLHCWLKSQGHSFKQVATLGRQTFYGVTKDSLNRAARKFGLALSDDDAQRILTGSDGFADGLYRWLGAETVDSFDFSDYEGATKLWDMNGSVPREFQENYDFVFDGGTLEHVFNYPKALREALTLPRVGGMFLSGTPANSYLGHGFYQLGPDLPFSVLSEGNGYRLEDALLVEMRHNSRFFEILPPNKRAGRALASTTWPTQMFFSGVRTGSVPENLTAFQPDYESAWENGQHQERTAGGAMETIRRSISWLPQELRNDLLRTAKLIYVGLSRNSLFDRTSFRRRDDI